jgi:hypothetical protein
MKKMIIITIIALVAAGAVAAQGTDAPHGAEIRGLLNVNGYVSNFGFKGGQVNTDTAIENEYLWVAPDNDLLNCGALAASEIPDTPLEFALLSYYSQPVVTIRPVEATQELPANSKISALKLGAATYMEMQMLRFAGRDVASYETVLKFIQDRDGVTRKEIMDYMTQGISAAVDEQFNRVAFTMGSPTGGYNAVLSRDTKTGGYKLSYEDANGVTKELSGTSLEDLVAKMSKSSDFDNEGIAEVRAQAANIPSAQFSATTFANIKARLTDFFLNPNKPGVYDAVTDISYIYASAYLKYGKAVFSRMTDAYTDTLNVLNPALASQVIKDAGTQTAVKTMSGSQVQELISLN